MNALRLRGQFSIRSLALGTLAAAALLAAMLRTGPLGAMVAGLLWLTAGGLLGALDYRSRYQLGVLCGPVLGGALAGGIAGLLWSAIALSVAAVGFAHLLWPGPGEAFCVYWWTATGAIVGGGLGCLIPSGAHNNAPIHAPGKAWWNSGVWLASAHLHLLLAMALSLGPDAPSPLVLLHEQAAWDQATYEPLDGGGMEDGFEAPFAPGPEIPVCGTEEIPEWEALPAPAEDPFANLVDREEPEARKTPNETLPAGLTRDEILKNVRRLADPAQRIDAKAWLLWRQAAVESVLQEILPGQPAVVQGELREILGGGALSNPRAARGLHLALSADKTVIQPGEAVTFTTTLTNTLKEPVNLYLGHNYRQSVPMFNPRIGVRGSPLEVATFARYRGNLGWCGVGLAHNFAIIPPGRTLICTTPAVFAANTASDPTAVYLIGAEKEWGLAAPAGSVHRFVATKEVTHHGNPRQRYGWDPDALLWTGKVTSNEVVIRIKVVPPWPLP